MARANISSVDTSDGYKIAHQGKEKKIADLAKYSQKDDNPTEQIVNAKKIAFSTLNKEKLKRKAKLAKASRKKNKK